MHVGIGRENKRERTNNNLTNQVQTTLLSTKSLSLPFLRTAIVVGVGNKTINDPIVKENMFNIYQGTGPTNLPLGLLHKHGSILIYNMSVFHCCIDIGVFINEDRWKVILSVKQVFKSSMVFPSLFRSLKSSIVINIDQYDQVIL